MADASVVYGPSRFVREADSPETVLENFSGNPGGNHTLVVRNGDGISNGSSSALIILNGEVVIRTNEFNQHIWMIKKNVSLGQENELAVQVRSIPGSYIAVWVEDESPDIVITSPVDDTVTSGMIRLAGYTMDRNVTGVNVTQSNNATVTSIPVSNGNFSASLYVHAPVQLNVSAVDSTGTLRTANWMTDPGIGEGTNWLLVEQDKFNMGLVDYVMNPPE